MGTYTDFRVCGKTAWTTKSRVDPVIMTIFRELDQKFLSDDGTEDFFIGYLTSVSTACHRLDIMGFSLEKCRQEFETNRKILIEEIKDNITPPDSEDDSYHLDEYYAEKMDLLEKMDFETYVDKLQNCINKSAPEYLFWVADNHKNNLDIIEKYIFDKQNDNWPFFGFLSNDIRYLIRVLLSLSDSSGEIVQDISDLVRGGDYDWLDKVCEDSVQSLVSSYPANSPIIILTEGSSDIEILQKSLEILYPSLIGYYTFFDFHSSNAGGGASELVKFVKSFAATGIANKIVAVFDNDSVGHDSKRALSKTQLSPNICVLHYPDIDLLNSYPTIGPSGEINLNVNRSAGSIELYLGKDILDSKGNLLPILWTSYIEKVGRYQGEVKDKAMIIDRWRDKAERCTKDQSLITKSDWDDLKKVWESIFKAFK